MSIPPSNTSHNGRTIELDADVAAAAAVFEYSAIMLCAAYGQADPLTMDAIFESYPPIGPDDQRCHSTVFAAAALANVIAVFLAQGNLTGPTGREASAL